MYTIDDKQLIAAVMERLGNIDARCANIEKAVLGDGQPGLSQRVEELEASKNRTIGGIAVLGVIGTGVWGFLEYIFHFRK